MENQLRKILNEGGKSLSTRISDRWGLMTELAAGSGCYDYVEYLAEYAPFTVEDFENAARACELHHTGSIVKVEFQNRAWTAQKALAAGIQGVLFTDCRTAADVEESIRVTMPDCPQYQGRVGYITYRWDSAGARISQTDYVQTVRNAVRLFMIEKREAVDNIEAICRVPGVDMIQFGPSDFSLSCGKNAADFKKECREAERHCIRVAQDCGVEPRCEIDSPEAAQYYMELGVKHFCLGDQVKILRNWWTENGRALRAQL